MKKSRLLDAVSICVFTFGLAMATSAQAITIMDDGDTFNILPGETEFIGNVVAAGSGGTWVVTFDATLAGSGNASTTIGNLVAGTFSDLTMQWLDSTDDSVISSVLITPTVTSLGTTFSSPDLLGQKLSISWTSSLAGAGFDVETVVSPVPIPAALWLFGSGLLGLVGMTRRKKAA